MVNAKTLLVQKKSVKINPKAWEKLEKLMFNGPKISSVDEVDLIQ